MDENEIRKNQNPKADKNFILNVGFLGRFRQLITELSIDVQKNFDAKKMDFFVRPRAPGIYPAVLVFHDWWGLDDYVRSVCLRFAKKGFVAMAPSLYQGEVTNREPIAKVLMRNAYPERVMPVIESYFEKLAAFPFVDSRNVGTVGFMMGGYYSLLAASRLNGISAAAVVYGRFPANILEDLPHINCPVFLASGGLEDWLDQEESTLIGETLTTNKIKTVVRRYDQARQDFMDDLHPQGYDYVSSEDAWKNIFEFFNECLRHKGREEERPIRRRFGKFGGAVIDWLEGFPLGEQFLKLLENASGGEEEEKEPEEPGPKPREEDPD